MRGLRWPGGRRPARSLGEQLRPQSMAAMRRRFPIADCDHGEARRSRKMDECEGRISARELVARRCWASVRSSAIADLGHQTRLGRLCVGNLPLTCLRRLMNACHFGLQPDPIPSSCLGLRKAERSMERAGVVCPDGVQVQA